MPVYPSEEGPAREPAEFADCHVSAVPPFSNESLKQQLLKSYVSHHHLHHCHRHNRFPSFLYDKDGFDFFMESSSACVSLKIVSAD